MNDHNTHNLGDLLKQVFKNNNLDDGLESSKIREIWFNSFTKSVREYTEKLYVRGSTLYVKIGSPALKQELMYNKSRLMSNINNELGKEIIKDIVFL